MIRIQDVQKTPPPPVVLPKKGFDKIAYQREYMRRRRAAQKEGEPASPSGQHAAHVALWFSTLTPISRLEHKAFVRRCVRGMA